jgi:acetoacetate decarboxylase
MIIEEHQGRAALMSPIDLDAIKRTVVRCHYLSKIVPIADEFQGVATLSNIINALAEEGLIWGWLAKPSSLELFNPAPGHGDFNPLKGLPAVNEAVFCFIFTKLSDAEFEARFPGWICAEGSVGKPL